jgi:hypothetical protein
VARVGWVGYLTGRTLGRRSLGEGGTRDCPVRGAESLNRPLEHQNPYQPPAGEGWVEPADEQRLLTARFEVDYRANYRVERFQFEQYRWFRQGSFTLQLVVFLVLLAGLIYRLPLSWVLLAACLLILLNLGQLLLPQMWTWRRLRAHERSGQWPVPWGEYRLEVNLDRLLVRHERNVQSWRLAELAHVYYLGDLLLIESEPNRFVPIPREADFGVDNFTSFCRLFTLRYQPRL